MIFRAALQIANIMAQVTSAKIPNMSDAQMLGRAQSDPPPHYQINTVYIFFFFLSIYTATPSLEDYEWSLVISAHNHIGP